ncbi:MAG: hypothetical protein WCG29_11855 [Desulfomonile sp.]
METVVGITIWVIIFVVWYVRTYPEKFRSVLASKRPASRKPQRRQKSGKPERSAKSEKNFNALVEIVENTCAMDRFLASDAAYMVQAVKQLIEMEPASGQIWEAYALDSLETAEIICDDCRIPVGKTVKKTGVRIHCNKCGKWLALKNSKVTLIDPSRADLEEWEK